jgi:hypothetical protein
MLGLSGGSLPTLLAAAICLLLESTHSKEQIRQAIPHWHMFLVDERCVPLDHAYSNYAACMRALWGADGPLEGLLDPRQLFPIAAGELVGGNGAVDQGVRERIARAYEGKIRGGPGY